MGGPWRLWSSWPTAAQSPRHRLSGAGDRTIWRIEIGFLDLQRAVQTAWARKLFFRRHQRDRLGQARLSRIRFTETYLLEKILKARLFRGAGGKGKTARSSVVPLVLREPQEGRTRSATAAVRLYRRISTRAADPIRQARVRMQFAQTLQRSRA